MKIVTSADGVAWVTGASSGIGREVAVQLARAGWTVAVSARRGDELATLAAAHKGMVAAPVDITDEAAVVAAVAKIEAETGRHVVRAVLNAGVYVRDTAADFSVKHFKTQVDVNLLGTANCLSAVMPGMLARRQGQIGLVSSVAGLNGLPGAVTYSATKAALISMAESLKFDFAKAGLGISVILPGFVKTPATAGNTYPMPFLMEVADAARVILAGMDKGKFMIAFPGGLAWPLRILRLLPSGAYFAIMARATKW
jgi:NAD(P)-dependent dehydrogenase (short-subunit alcohol dehydrogenase family)